MNLFTGLFLGSFVVFYLGLLLYIVVRVIMDRRQDQEPLGHPPH